MTITIHGEHVTVNCCGEDPPPVPAPTVLHREALYGLACATILPEQAGIWTSLSQQMVCTKALLPAGKNITHLGVSVASEARGVATGEARLAVYSVGGSLIGRTGDDNKLFTGTDWRFSELASPVPAEPEDRVVWLVALVPTYDIRQPSLLAAGTPVVTVPRLFNPLGFRSFTQPDRSELPDDIGGDYPALDKVVCIVGADLSVS
ncbi:hypothetical protein [Streptosporangium sp. H16]|uniref:hypothetical protein n=1 Tax=Streptosporangium sp. H16 TaxID=3444184 RepID=UPI003F78DC31